MAYKIIHYINQFFAGIGGEEKADIAPEVREGLVGPGVAFKAAFGDQAEIVATFICGDNYCANHLDEVAAQMVETVKRFGADGVIAGPAFNAGRYGTACGAVWRPSTSSLACLWSAACTVKAPALTCTARK